MKEAAANLRQAGVDANFLLFLEYTDALKYVADHAQGKIVFMDNGSGAAVRVAQQIAALGIEADHAGSPPAPSRTGGMPGPGQGGMPGPAPGL